MGASAIVGAVFAMAELPLYFVVPACDPSVCGAETGSPMPDWLILVRTLFNFLALTLFLVFMVSVRFLIARADARYEWFGAVAGTAGVAWTIVDMIAKGLEGGSAIQAPDLIDPTRAVPTYLLYGSISHLMLFVFGLAFGYAVLRTGVLPRWVGWSSFAVAALHLVGVPSMFFGFNSSEFYASNGWGAVAMFNGIAALWLAAVGVATLMTRSDSGSDRTVADRAMVG
ncbi:hypothetical protein [Leifsonia sp. NPDC080035]|uniref:Integral membrane protein n=1 Tax=Leifsonia sp. NPDC080035 TaxID=3143936 RepID=A0AAU7GEH6_9MICO